MLINAAERHLDAGTTALFINVGPILIAVLAGLFLREGFPRRLVTGLAIAFVGVVTIAVATSTGRRDLTGRCSPSARPPLADPHNCPQVVGSWRCPPRNSSTVVRILMVQWSTVDS